MDIINDIFNNLADKIPLEFLHGNFTVFGYAFSKLFAIAVALLLLIIILIIVVSVLVAKDKKKKKLSVEQVQPITQAENGDSALSSTPVKAAATADGSLHKAVATPNCEFELPSEDELTSAEHVVDINQVIIDEMDEKAKAVMLDEFDFDIEIDALCDFDTELEDSDEVEDEDEEYYEEETTSVESVSSTVPVESVASIPSQETPIHIEKKPRIRYERSFQARLIQTNSNNKARYNVIKNLLANYDKVRNSSSWNNESFISGKNLIARIYLIGKTLRVCLALNPDDYSENIYHHEDKSATSKYKTVPMMIKIKSRLGLKRAVSLIIDLAEKFELKKSKKLRIVDYIAANPYQHDAELLKRGLIRLENPERYKINKRASKAENIVKTPAKPVVKNAKALTAAADAAEKASGKYVFAKKADGIHFALIANNGQLLLESINGYTTYAGAKRGVDTFIKTVKEGDFIIDDDKFGRYRFILKSKNSLSTYTGEAYKTKAAAESSASSVKRFALTAAITSLEE